MKKRPLIALTVLALVFTACGPGGEPEAADGDPLLQVGSEGGFVPVEIALGTGPRYTLLGDGRLIYQGAQTMEFPGPLLPRYVMAQLTPSQVDALLSLVEDIGLPGIDDEADNSANQFVADASTEMVTYWDDNGRHRLSVYALGIEESPSARNAAFLDLIETLDRFTAEADTENYVPETVQVIAGPGFINQDFQDTRPWPLDDDQTAWSELANGWTCRVLGSEVLDLFEGATQATVWEEPDLFDFPSPVKLLVRPLLPGEPDCP
jgi:hypothetical protein